MDKDQAKLRVKTLKEKIIKANKAYFLENSELVPENVRDSLKRELIALEEKYPDLITSDSPTQRVWIALDWFLPKIKHNKKKESLSDVFSFDEILKWLERIWKDIPWDFKTSKQVAKLWFTCELKIDWLNLTIAYKNGLLFKAATRWDWFVWEDVTNNIKAIMDIPLSIDHKTEDFEVSWEVFMSKNAFKFVQKNEWDIFKNPRNCASWTLRQLDPQMVANRHLSFFAYEINPIDDNFDLSISSLQINQQILKLNVLESLEFQIESHTRICNNIEDIKNFIELWTKNKNSLNYEIDWVVIKLNDLTLQKRLWSTAKSPRWAIAYKFPAKLAQSIIKDIILQVGRTWVITPVAILNPVILDWSTISRATLHNFDEIERLDVRIWDTVIIEKAWDIIPKVNEVIQDMRNNDSIKYIIPEYCLDCWSKLLKLKREVAIKCVNPICSSKHIQKLIHFSSRNALNIEWCWDKVIIQLVENKLIEDFWDIFTLNFWDLFTLPSFQEKKARNLLESIEKSKNHYLSEFIFWLWIPFVWEETSQIIAKLISQNISIRKTEILSKNSQISLFWNDDNPWEQLITCLPSDMVSYIKNNIKKIFELEWIWEKVAISIETYFNDENNIKVIMKLEKSWVYPQIEKISNFEQIFKSKTFVLTWALPTLSREKAKEEIKKRGWSVSSSVSKNTNYVLAWEEPWEKLIKATKLWIKVINEEDFIKIIS